MGKINYFLKEKKEIVENKKVVVSKGFKDENGEPIAWEIRQISQAESDQLKEDCTIRTKKKGARDITENFQSAKFTNALITSAVVYPDLKDPDTLKSYGLLKISDLLPKMLTVGEYSDLAEAVLEHNGLDADEEIIEAAKNS